MNKAGNSAETSRPLLGHIHVPKSAGSSIRRVLDRAFGATHLHLYDWPTSFVLQESELAEFIRRREVAAFSSHFVRTFPKQILGRPVHYVTFLRDPVLQFISYLRYTRRLYQSITDEVLRMHLPPAMDTLTLRECARWVLAGDLRDFRNFRDNYVANFFARYEVLERQGISYFDRRYRRMRLKTAKEVLERFAFVGIAERLDESWKVMRVRLERIGIRVPEAQIPRENVSDCAAEDLSWINKRDEVGRALLDSLKEDQVLYRLYNDKLKRDVRELEVRPRS